VTETAHSVHIVLALRLPGVTAGCYLRIFAFYLQCLTVASMGVRRNFFKGEQSRHFAYLFQFVGDATQMDVYKKRKCTMLPQLLHTVFSSEQMFVLVSMDTLRLS